MTVEHLTFALVFVDLPLTDGSTASVRVDQIVSVSDATPRPADRGLPVRTTRPRSRVTTTSSLDVTVDLHRTDVLTLLRAAARIDLTADLAEVTHPPAPVWDEDAAFEAARDEAEQRWPTPPPHADEYTYPQSAVRATGRAAFEAGAEWQREHLPTRPDRETVALTLCRVQRSTEHMEQTDDAPCSRCFAWADAVLALLPGRSDAEVRAEALREEADRIDASSKALPGMTVSDATRALRTHADRIEGENRG